MAKISLTISEINSIVTRLNSSSDTIENTWKSIKTEEIEKLKTSWVGSDCDAYINKILELDTQVTNAIEAQRLLASTYESARKQIEETQANNASSIANI